jgi:hypothetical protein
MRVRNEVFESISLSHPVNKVNGYWTLERALTCRTASQFLDSRDPSRLHNDLLNQYLSYIATTFRGASPPVMISVPVFGRRRQSHRSTVRYLPHAKHPPMLGLEAPTILTIVLQRHSQAYILMGIDTDSSSMSSALAIIVRYNCYLAPITSIVSGRCCNVRPRGGTCHDDAVQGSTQFYPPPPRRDASPAASNGSDKYGVFMSESHL